MGEEAADRPMSRLGRRESRRTCGASPGLVASERRVPFRSAVLARSVPPVACLLWRASCGVPPVACLLWRASCGVPPVACLLWRASCGVRPSGAACLLWSAPRVERATRVWSVPRVERATRVWSVPRVEHAARVWISVQPARRVCDRPRKNAVLRGLRLTRLHSAPGSPTSAGRLDPRTSTHPPRLGASTHPPRPTHFDPPASARRLDPRTSTHPPRPTQVD